MCTTCKTSCCYTTPVRCTRSDLLWGGMWTSFLIQFGGPYDVLSLVHWNFVAATCCWTCTHSATMLLSLILSLWSVVRIQMSHEANCCGLLVPATCRSDGNVACRGHETLKSRCTCGMHLIAFFFPVLFLITKFNEVLTAANNSHFFILQLLLKWPIPQSNLDPTSENCEENK